MRDQPSYGKVFLTFARNSLVRDMTFRVNFLLEAITSLCWMLMNQGFYLLVFQYTPSIAGWNREQFFAFLATTMLINSLVQTFFMPNAEELSEMIRTGGLDFALLKPIDTQFLISLGRVEWSSLSNFVYGLGLLGYSLWALQHVPRLDQLLLYPLFILCGVSILYSLTISLASTSIWLGRNQSLYDFWFYITNFARYPREVYHGTYGTPLRMFFTFIIPVLVVVNVPAELIVKTLSWENWLLAGYALLAAVLSLFGSRWVFQRALLSYRSASS